ncbi:hypothetical protein CRUP_001530 [Coryphaenoides rupestris]|nr:hypothetical protein CRUP_001530 [Coryphaenoides rupestris]
MLLVLLFLTASVMMIATISTLPSPLAHVARWPSRALSSAGGVASRMGLRAEDPTPAAPLQSHPGPPFPMHLLPLPNLHSGSWRGSRVGKKEPSTPLETAVGPFGLHGGMDSDRRKIRRSPGAPWLSDDDLEKMELLAAGEVVSKARVPAHGQVLQVALNLNSTQQNSIQTSPGELKKDQTTQHALRRLASESHSEQCRRGSCSLVKRPDDWYEVLAFHLDRVLGLNRSLPVVLRTFPQSDVLPYKYTSGAPRPVVWWDPNIQHLDDRDNDQNSVPLSWVQYQELLKAHCGEKVDLNAAPCVGVHHSEWGRLALFDFLLQSEDVADEAGFSGVFALDISDVSSIRGLRSGARPDKQLRSGVNDRLDRCCCGFRPDPAESCVENLLYVKCRNSKEQVLVHILVRKMDPSRMVFIDNAGRPQQTADNLNFRLVEGVEEFPEQAMALLRSGCLEALLLRSLYTDREFWERHGGGGAGGGADGGAGGGGGLRTLVRTVAQRGRILLQHIGDRRLRLNRDL